MGGNPWWIWALVVIGALALIMVIASLFLPDFHEPDLELDVDPDPESDEFVDVLAGALGAPVLKGGTAEILQNGDAYFPAILDAINGARQTVNFQCYIWESGKVSDSIIDALVGARQRGVEVRVHPDAFGAMKFKGEDRKRLTDADVKLEFFRPLKWYSLVRLFKRSHQRAIVIDGEVAFTGGAAVADKWAGDARNKEEWRDSMTMVTGALVGGVQAAFANDWIYSCGEIISGPRFYGTPPTAAEGPADAEEILGVPVVSSPSDTDQPVRVLQWLVFRSARKRLWISNSYFIPDARLRKIVVDRAQAGVDVRILVPGGNTDARPVRRAGHVFYEELLKGGVRMYEYQKTMMHAKVVAVDGLWSVVGSANLDERSMELNEENCLAIRSRSLTADIERALEEDFTHSKEFTLEEWCKRPFTARCAERCSMLLMEQY